MAVAYAALAGTIVGGAGFYLREQRGDVRRGAESQLSAIADLKVQQIVDWRRERLGDARFFSQAAFVPRDVQAFFDNPSPASESELIRWLTLLKSDRYARVALFDARGELRLGLPDDQRPLGQVLRGHVADVLRDPRIRMSDLYRGDTGAIQLDLAIPVFAPGTLAADSPRPSSLLAIILLELDPHRFLYPLIQSWPIPSRTAETLLVRRDGDAVLLLNELRSFTNTALSLRVPLTRTNLPTVRAALGEVGVGEGVDYRDAPVLAAMRPVPEMPWFMVFKLDAAEIQAPLRQRAWAVGLVATLLALAGGLALALLWRRRDAELLRRDLTFREHAEAELHRFNRALRVIGECNQLLARATTEERLLRRICDLLVEDGGYRMAWVGLAEHDEARSVRPVAQAGFEEGYLRTVNITWADTERGRGPTGTAIRTGQSVIARQIPDDPAYDPWREAAVQRGYASSIALPLNGDDRAFGALMIYSAQSDAFDAAEVGLLAELAGDLAYGLKALRTQASLQQEQRFLAALFDNLGEAVVSCDAQGRLARFNRTARVLHDLPEQPILPEPWATHYDHYASDGQTLLGKEAIPLFRALQGEQVRGFEMVVSAKHGSPRRLMASGQPLRDGAGQIIGAVATMHDITERRQVEEAVLRERDFSEAVLNSLPGVVYCYDQDFRFLRWNKNLERVLGCTAAEIARMNPLDFFADPDQGHVAAWIQAVFEEGTSEVEADLVATDGTRTPYYFTGLRVEIDGRPHLVGVGIDITEPKRVEQERQKFFILAESSAEFIGICDLDLKPLYVNPAGMRMVGLPDKAAACRVQVQDYFFPEDQRFIAEEFFPRVLQEGHGDVEIRLRHFQTGEPIWMFYYLFSVRDNSGTPVGWATVSRDITERRRAQAELRDSEERLRLALDAAHLGTFDWDVPRNRIVWSRRHEELWGVEPGEFGGTYEAFSQRVHPEDLPAINAAVARSVADAVPLRSEFRVVWPDASVHWILWAGEFTFGSGGEPLRMRGAVMEITARRQAEEEARRSQEQLRALAAHVEAIREEERTRISREIHDELGQMLTGIRMDLRWIEHRLDDFGDDRRLNPILDKLVAAAELTDATVRTVQRIAAELRPGILDKLGLSMALQFEVSRFEQRTGAPCSLMLPGEDPPLSSQAATTFFRILQEALTNVSRHAQATAVEVELRREAEFCRLDIRDNGRGISEVGLSDPKSLGLLGMRERAQLLGGEVVFTPRPGGGTVVSVLIPVPPNTRSGV